VQTAAGILKMALKKLLPEALKNEIRAQVSGYILCLKVTRMPAMFKCCDYFILDSSNNF